MTQWAEVRHLHLVEEVPKREIARRLKLDVKTVRRAISQPTPPARVSPPRPSSLDPWRERITQWLREEPRVTAKRIRRLLMPLTGPVSARTVRRYVAGLRAAVAPKEAFVHRSVRAATTMEVDFGESWVDIAGVLLVGVQVTLTVVLLVAGGLLLVSFVRVMQVDRGFEPASVVAVDLNLPASRYDPARRTQLHDDLLARLAAAPVVSSAGVTQRLPLEGEAWVDTLIPAGDTPPGPAEMAALHGNYRFVSPDYFRTLGMVLTRGRLFTEEDRTRPVAVVTAQTASRLWPDLNPVGQRFLGGNSREPHEVVGVVADARILGLDVDPGLVAYLPYWGFAPSSVTVVARGPETRAVVASVREAVRGLDLLLPVSNLRVLDEVLAASVAVRRFLLLVTVAFAIAIAGLALVCLGVFGTVSQRAVRRRREFAIRLTLGATRGRIVATCALQGLRPVAAGLSVGLVVSLATARFIEALLFEVAPLDPVVLGGAAGVVLGLGAVACLLPAARALRAPPARTLNADRTCRAGWGSLGGGPCESATTADGDGRGEPSVDVRALRSTSQTPSRPRAPAPQLEAFQSAADGASTKSRSRRRSRSSAPEANARRPRSVLSSARRGFSPPKHPSQPRRSPTGPRGPTVAVDELGRTARAPRSRRRRRRRAGRRGGGTRRRKRRSSTTGRRTR